MRGILPIIVVILIILGGWYLFSKPASTASNTTITTEQATSGTVVATTTQTAVKEVTIAYTATGFSPKTVTVAAGTKVTFVNQTSGRMWVASGVHPIHTSYDGTTKNEHCAVGYSGPAPFDECATGSSYSFVFNKVGSWEFHNHANASDVGSVVVTAGTAATPI